MSDNVRDLFLEGKISKREFNLYLIFEANDIGRQLLPELIMDSLMESPEEIGTSEAFVHHQGRLSVWRDMKMAIERIKIAMEKQRHDRDSSKR